jgi:hypothetical protein
MRRHSLCFGLVPLLAIPFVGATATAQSSAAPPPPVTRQINLPDTLGASFSIADSTTGSGNPNDFDFLVGVWEFRFQQRNQNGTFTPAFVGHWFAERKKNPNGFVEDHFRPDNPTATYDVGTWTYRVFNPQRKLWEMQGIGSEAGQWQPGLCWSDANNRYVIQHYGSTIMRIRYFAITDNTFLWRADASNDGGKTWQLDRWTMSARRISK